MLAREEGVSVLFGINVLQINENDVLFEQDGIRLCVSGEHVILERKAAENKDVSSPAGFTFQCRNVKSGIADAAAAGVETAAEIDVMLRGAKAVLLKTAKSKTVNVERVRERVGYQKRNPNPIQLNAPAEERRKTFLSYRRLLTEKEAVSEAERCLNCGCGEGCQLCKTICCEFAPEVVSPDQLSINKDACVACGMCFNRCPNGNIEMINSGLKV